jgi:hypothetical protein
VHLRISRARRSRTSPGKSSGDYEKSLTSKATDAATGYIKDYAHNVGEATSELGKATAANTVGGTIKETAKTAAGIGEAAAGVVGGVVGDVAGAVASTATQNEKTGAKIRDAITKFSAPTTPEGKAVAGEIGAVTKPLGDLFELLPKYLEENGHRHCCFRLESRS